MRQQVQAHRFTCYSTNTVSCDFQAHQILFCFAFFLSSCWWRCFLAAAVLLMSLFSICPRPNRFKEKKNILLNKIDLFRAEIFFQLKKNKKEIVLVFFK